VGLDVNEAGSDNSSFLIPLNIEPKSFAGDFLSEKSGYGSSISIASTAGAPGVVGRMSVTLDPTRPASKG
jgi:hypothetical protein